MLIVEGHIDSPILRKALRDVPGMTVIHEELYVIEGKVQYFFWAEGGDFDAFEAAIEHDPTVTGATVLAEAGDRYLYRLTLTEAGEEVATFPTWGEFGLVMLDSRATHEGWRVRMRFPDRESLGGYLDACRQRGLSFVVDAIYSGADAPRDVGVDLTEVQRETLLTALERGYFEIPRNASLDDVASRLNVSAQAVSERLRRGMAALVETSLSPERTRH